MDIKMKKYVAMEKDLEIANEELNKSEQARNVL